jgi:hypothetical protein
MCTNACPRALRHPCEADTSTNLEWQIAESRRLTERSKVLTRAGRAIVAGSRAAIAKSRWIMAAVMFAPTQHGDGDTAPRPTHPD